MKRKIALTFIILLILALPLSLVLRYSQKNVKGARTEKERAEEVKGVILPHHNFAKEVLVGSYDEISREKFDLIVVIGPNHFYPEIKEFVIPDTELWENLPNEIIQELIEKKENILLENKIIEGEHSITVQKQYINEYFPEAKILPIVVPQKYNEGEIKDLADTLSKISYKTLFIASVDFSHNLLYQEALEKNNETIEAIKTFNYSTINSFDDRNLDSPGSISLLLKIMENLNAKKFRVLYNMHGALIANDPKLKGTSYVVGVFTE